MIDAAKFACLINFGLFDYQRFSATTMLGFWLLLVGTSQYQLSPIANHKPVYGLATTLASYSVLIKILLYFILAINHITVNIAQFDRSGMIESLLIHHGNIMFLYKRSVPTLCGHWFHISLGLAGSYARLFALSEVCDAICFQPICCISLSYGLCRASGNRI
jgi:hypothetical protein